MRNIIITENDLSILRSYVGDSDEINHLPEHLKKLHAELKTADVISSGDMPSDVVTMNSRVEFIDLKTNETFEYTLVFPPEANIDENRISVCVPLGAALLGYRVGDVVEWPVPSGIASIRITRILYQPETAGKTGL
jgi:regulator of nucleoside diphosphate kinase